MSLKDWWRGKFIEPNLDDLINSRAGRYQRPPLARFVSAIAGFWKKEWKWILSFIAGIIFLIIRFF